MTRERYKVLQRMNFESPYVDMPHRWTVRQNLTVFARLYGVGYPAGAVERLVGDCRSPIFIDRTVGRLSAGQTTWVAFAKALINDLDVLLLDEPTASLDPNTADWVRR